MLENYVSIDWNVLNNKAKELFDSKKFKEALDLLQRQDLPEELKPNLAKCYYYNKQADKALELIENIQDKSHELSIDYSLYLNAIGRFTEAFRILQSLDQSDPKVKFNLGWHYLRTGDFKKGFEYLQHGSECRAWGNEYIYIEQGILDPSKRYKNENVKDKKVLYILEGGLGDQMAFLRWVDDFFDICEDVTIACDRSLLRLLINTGYDCISLDQIKNFEYDVYVPAMSYPAIAGIESPQRQYQVIPYIDAPSERYTKKILNSVNPENKTKIGIKWFGNPEFEHDQFRTVPMGKLKNLASRYGMVYSLQFEDNDQNIPNCKDLIRDWQDTYNVISSLDVVITSCTSIAHLCGAMGKSCIVMVPLVSYFIWSNDNLAWYDTVHVVRQKKYNDWTEAFQEVENLLGNNLY